VKFTRRMYADYLGVSERTVNRSVKRLEDNGSITRVNQSLIVLDPS
jgi:DNA-binding Lrp family transcriptional regulator